MARRGWPVTFSIGVVTVCDEQADVNALLREADALMYEVKRGAKDGIRHADDVRAEEVKAL